MKIESFSIEDTLKIGTEAGQGAQAGMIFCLTGDLGTGKTVFTKGFAKGLGIEETITSPTFTIMNVYEGRLPLYHFDVYRISSLEEMDDTGYEDFFFGSGVCLVEWAELVQELIPDDAVWVTIEKDYTKAEDYRCIHIETKARKTEFL